MPRPTAAPPTPETTLAALRAREPILRAAGIAALYLYGSTARGTATPASDIDLFLDQADPETFSLIELVRLTETIQEALGGTTVDLTTRGGLHPLLRPAIEASAVKVF